MTEAPNRAGQLSWVVHPLSQEPPIKSAALVAVIVGFSLLAAATLDGAVYGILSIVALSLSMAPYFLPTRYTVDEGGVAWRLLVGHRRPWQDFARVEERANGLLLSPFVRPTRLDTYRGVHLRFGPHADNRAVTAMATSRVAP